MKTPSLETACTGALATALLAASLWAMDAAPPEHALVRLRCYGGGGEFVIRTLQGVQAALGWLAQVEKGPDSEHARNGLCDRDAELELYKAATDARPARVVELFTSCKHVLKKEVTAAQFAALRKLAEEKGERLLAITERDNGKTLDATVGQAIEVQLRGGEAATGWEAGAVEGDAVQRQGAQPGEVNVSATPAFIATPGATDKSIGTYIFRYKAVKAGQAKLRFVYVMPGGPFPIRRSATRLAKDLAVTVKVAAAPK